MDKQTSFGLITTVEVPVALNFKSSCWSEKGLLLANYIFDKAEVNSAYKIAYTLVDNQGNIEEVMQSEGAMPVLFLNSKKQNFVCLTKVESNEEKAIVLPVNKERQSGQSEIAPFSGHFVGCTKESSIFYHVDLWKETTLDVMTILHFDENNTITQTQVEIPLPKGNKISLFNNEIHLIAEMEEGWLHRQIDETGTEIKRRILDFDLPFVHEALMLSFDSNAYLLCEENGEIGVVEIDTEDNCNYTELFNIGDEFFGTWHPQRISQDIAAVQFTTEFGNGWITLKKDELLELFYNKNKKGYKDLVTKQILSIDSNDLALGGINAIDSNSFSVVFYPRKTRKESYNQAFILQRSLK